VQPATADAIRRPPGRPRDTDREHAILQAVLDLVAEDGYESLSIEAVAHRARSSKATIYRRWANKRELVAAAVKARSGTPLPPVDTGSLFGDLVALCQRLAAILQSSEGGLILGLLKGGLEDPDLCQLLEDASGLTGARLPAAVLERAVARGELPSDTDSFAYEEVVGAVLIVRVLNGYAIDDAYLSHLVDTVLLPALAHPRPPGRPRLPGLFSGAKLPPRGRPDAVSAARHAPDTPATVSTPAAPPRAAEKGHHRP